MNAYLVEAQSWGGHSGSPAFVYFYATRRRWVKDPDERPFPLLGLVHGHFSVDAGVKFSGDVFYGKGEVPLNSGMAIVIPAQDILDLLMDDEFVEMRDKYEQLILAYRKSGAGGD